MCLDWQVVAYDFGIKHNILRRLASQGCKLTVVPAAYPAEKVLELNPDGIFLSNGPVRLSPGTAKPDAVPPSCTGKRFSAYAMRVLPFVCSHGLAHSQPSYLC